MAEYEFEKGDVSKLLTHLEISDNQISEAEKKRMFFKWILPADKFEIFDWQLDGRNQAVSDGEI